jgi:sugar lactone lactonase YvrE
MRSASLFSIIALINVQITVAQSVGIGTNTPNTSARLEVSSTTQGILIPTLTSTQRSAVVHPATGLLVFQTDGTPGFYYYTGLAWVNLTNGYQVNEEGVAVSSNYGLTTTLAGTGAAGEIDGPGTVATFSSPEGVAVDASGNIYVADYGNDKIRKITSTGVVSTLAGIDAFGSDDGPVATATFNLPMDVAVDASGNVYVADYNNNKIRKITWSGIVSTLAGSGVQGSTDGTGAAATFHLPTGVAVDASGNVYVADSESNKIRKITPGGVVTTLAGSGSAGNADGSGAAASFNNPRGVTVDAFGNIYVADHGNHKIRKITPAGTVSTLAGSGTLGSTDGIGTAASFRFPHSVAVDVFGNVYVADKSNNKIRKITKAGVVSTLSGSGSSGAADGTGTAASFDQPAGIAVDVSGNIYVADTQNKKIRKIIAQ